MRSARLFTHLFVALLTSAAVACGGGESPSQPSDPGDGDDDQNPSITLTISPTSITITQGESGEITVTISRSGGFTGQVTVSASGLPEGVTAGSATIAGGSSESTLTIQASESAETGSATATLEANGSGVSSVSQDLDLEVEEAAPQSSTTALTFCEASGGVPEWMAIKDGDGSWTRIDGDASNTFEFEHSAGRIGVAYTTTGTAAATTVSYFTRSEIQSTAETQCSGSGAVKTVNGSVPGLGQSQQAQITMGGATATAAGGQTQFTLEGVADGPRDLVAGRQSLDLQTGTFAADRLIIRRDLDPEDGATLDPLDFGAEGFDPATAQATLQGVAEGETALLTTSFVTSGGTPGSFFTKTNVDASQPQEYAGIPADQLEQGDFHYLQLIAVEQNGEQVSGARLGVHLFQEVENRTISVGPPLAEPTVSVEATDPYVRTRARYSVQSEYDRYWSLRWSQDDGTSVTVNATAAWLGDATELDVTIPDFSGVEGWNDAWALSAGSDVQWNLNAVGWTGSDGIVQADFQEGVVIMTGQSSGTVTP